MLKYSYKAKDNYGKEISGIIKAKDKEAAIIKLNQLKLNIESLNEFKTKYTIEVFFQKKITSPQP